MTAKHHKHLIIDAKIKYAPRDEKEVKKLLVKSIKEVKMNVADLNPKRSIFNFFKKKQGNPIAWYCEDKDNEGMTAIGILTTSHISLHVWDRLDVAELHFDLYSCSDFTVKQVKEILNSHFGLLSGDGLFIDRVSRKVSKFKIGV